MKKIVTLLMAVVMLMGIVPTLNVIAEEDDDWEPVITIDDPIYLKINGISLSNGDDRIEVKVNYERREYESGPYFCMYVYDYTTAQWSLVGGWQTSNQFIWYPDANDNYAIVIYGGYKNSQLYVNKKGEIKEENVQYMSLGSYWQAVNRPQMGKHVIADCAVPTSEGLLFGCTSNVTSSDSGYYTTCYIWSDARKAWIAQMPYHASESAWFKVSTLPKGTYMMYTCTEKMMSNGQRRKLSCKYYVFGV